MKPGPFVLKLGTSEQQSRGDNMTIALMLLKKYWYLVVAAVAVLVIYLYMQGLYNTIDDQTKKITELTTANQILKDNTAKLEKAITVNNLAIETMAKGAADTNRAFGTLSGSIKQQSTDLQKRLNDILKDKKPQTCEQTIEYLVDAVKGYAK